MANQQNVTSGPLDSPSCVVCEASSASCGSKCGYELFRCSACSHLFVWPMPSTTDSIYSADYFSGAKAGFGYTDYDNDKRAMIPTFEKCLSRIEAAVGSTGALLDVGAATGFFLDLAKRRKWQVQGVELSVSASAVARSKGLDVATGSVESCELPASSFDAVSMWDVIEHLTDPPGTMNSVRRILKPKGVLAINTPDSTSAVSRLLGLKWHLVTPPEHLNLFSQYSLRLLLEKHGFEVLEVTRISKTFTVQYTLHFLLKTLGMVNGAAARVSDGLNGTKLGLLGIPINLRDNMFVLARKR